MGDGSSGARLPEMRGLGLLAVVMEMVCGCADEELVEEGGSAKRLANMSGSCGQCVGVWECEDVCVWGCGCVRMWVCGGVKVWGYGGVRLWRV